MNFFGLRSAEQHPALAFQACLYMTVARQRHVMISDDGKLWVNYHNNIIYYYFSFNSVTIPSRRPIPTTLLFSFQ